METIGYLIGMSLVGFWGYKIAEKNGRNKFLASILCALFGLFGIFAYYCIGRTDEKDLERLEELNKRAENRKKCEELPTE